MRYLLFFLFISCSVKVDYEPQLVVYDSDVNELLLDINNYREINQLSILLPEKELTLIAYKHNIYMMNENKISHNGYEDRKRTSDEFGFTYYSEIVGAGYNCNNDLFTNYIKSQEHKEIIDMEKLTHIGISKEYKNGVMFNVIVFAQHRIY